MGAGCPILLVEDDAALREELREVLTDAGHRVVEAEDGWQALMFLRRERPTCGLVVLDMGLPIMNGWELLGRIRADVEMQKLPVIIMSARPVANVPEQPPVFLKPIPIPAFLDAVRSFVDPGAR